MANVDFTDPAWDEEDSGNDITITASKVDCSTLQNQADAHVSDTAADQGVSLAGDFTHEFEIYIASGSNDFCNPGLIIGP